MTERIIKALEYNTLPRFVYKLVDEPFYRNYEADVQGIGDSFFAEFRNPKQVIQDIINPRAEIPLELSDEDIFKYYILVNRALRVSGLAPNFITIQWNLSPDETYVFERLFETILNVALVADRDELVLDIQQERAEFAADAQQTRLEFDLYQSAAGGWISSAAEEVARGIVYELQINNTLLGIFNNARLSNRLEYISTFKYYKKNVSTLQSIEYPQEYNELFLFFEETLLHLTLSPNSTFIEPRYRLVLPARLSVLRELTEPLQVDSIDEIEEVIDVKFETKSPNLDNLVINKFIWADLVMNSILSNEFVINESERATKTLNTIHMWWIVSDKRTSFQFVQRGPSVEVKLFNATKDKVADFQGKFSRAMGFYQASAREIAAQYNTLLLAPIDLAGAQAEVRDKLKYIASDIYTGGAVRSSCQLYPRIVDRAEADELEMKGIQIMPFPKGDNPYLFSCDRRPLHPFVGLTRNKTKTQETYPLLPCCFKQDQRKKASFYREYYEGIQKKTRVSKVPIKTEKLANEGQYGTLPNLLEDYFISIEEFKVKRLGVEMGASSIITCIMNTIHKRITEIDSIKIRKNLSSDKKVLCINQQETGDSSYAQVSAELDDERLFIEAARFYSLLCASFEIRLVLFTKDGFKGPQVRDGYIWRDLNPEWPVVLVYENMGSKTEGLLFPQYEIISSVSNKEIIYQNFRDSIQTVWAPRGRIENYTPFSDEKETLTFSRVEGQILNLYKHVVALNLVPRDEEVARTFYLSRPLYPLNLPETDEILPSLSYSEEIIDLPEIGSVAGYFKSSDVGESLMDKFLDVREYSKSLLEQAKYISSKYGEIKYKISDERVDKNKWIKGNVLPVPSELAREKLNASIDIFQNQQRERFEEYKLLKYIPFTYSSILDFDIQKDVFIGEIGAIEIDQTPFIMFNEPIDAREFFLRLDGQVFYCRQIREIPGSMKTLFLWETRERIVIGQGNLEILMAGSLIYSLARVV